MHIGNAKTMASNCFRKFTFWLDGMLCDCGVPFGKKDHTLSVYVCFIVVDDAQTAIYIVCAAKRIKCGAFTFQKLYIYMSGVCHLSLRSFSVRFCVWIAGAGVRESSICIGQYMPHYTFIRRHFSLLLCYSVLLFTKMRCRNCFSSCCLFLYLHIYISRRFEFPYNI